MVECSDAVDVLEAAMVVLAPRRVEAQVMGEGVVVTGAGAGAVGAVVGEMRARILPGTPVAVAGTAERLHPDLDSGQLVVADELWSIDGSGRAVARPVPSAAILAAELRREGHRVTVGPVATVHDPDPAVGARATLAERGALVLDADSAWAAALAGEDGPLAVVRAVETTGGPGAMAALDTRHAAAALARVRSPLERWARACSSRRVVLAAPRAFCAGVERAIEIVERAIERFGAPVYVRRQIVHNVHVVERLTRMGAVFVQELSEVPDGATVVLAAHGVSPDVREEAASRDGFTVIDATCPLVAKVHHEARRYAAKGFDIVLVGHGDHEEVVGTYGEAPERTHVVASLAEVDRLEMPVGAPVAYLTQTTLATDETATVVDALRRRFPSLVGPNANDICYATQNRQDALRTIAGECDLVLVVGSANSSNTARLVEVARRGGARAELVEDAGQLRLAWLEGARTVGLTAGASAPESLVAEMVQALSGLGPIEVDEQRTATETVRFALPIQVR
jgi:4-hydroxy-3-methylbut-2-enyl diphosphate reductase